MNAKEMLAYGDAGIKRLHETLAAEPEAFERGFRTISSYPSIKALVAHMVGAEERWLDRAQGRVPGSRYENNPLGGIDEVFEDWKKRRKQTKDYIYSLDMMKMSTGISMQGTGGQHVFAMTPDQIVYHLINHQTYHTAQISMALQLLSIDPPNFDYPALMT